MTRTARARGALLALHFGALLGAPADFAAAEPLEVGAIYEIGILGYEESEQLGRNASGGAAANSTVEVSPRVWPARMELIESLPDGITPASILRSRLSFSTAADDRIFLVKVPAVCLPPEAAESIAPFEEFWELAPTRMGVGETFTQTIELPRLGDTGPRPPLGTASALELIEIPVAHGDDVPASALEVRLMHAQGDPMACFMITEPRLLCLDRRRLGPDGVYRLARTVSAGPPFGSPALGAPFIFSNFEMYLEVVDPSGAPPLRIPIPSNSTIVSAVSEDREDAARLDAFARAIDDEAPSDSHTGTAEPDPVILKWSEFVEAPSSELSFPGPSFWTTLKPTAPTETIDAAAGRLRRIGSIYAIRAEPIFDSTRAATLEPRDASVTAQLNFVAADASHSPMEARLLASFPAGVRYLRVSCDDLPAPLRAHFLPGTPLVVGRHEYSVEYAESLLAFDLQAAFEADDGVFLPFEELTILDAAGNPARHVEASLRPLTDEGENLLRLGEPIAEPSLGADGRLPVPRPLVSDTRNPGAARVVQAIPKEPLRSLVFADPMSGMEEILPRPTFADAMQQLPAPPVGFAASPLARTLAPGAPSRIQLLLPATAEGDADGPAPTVFAGAIVDARGEPLTRCELRVFAKTAAEIVWNWHTLRVPDSGRFRFDVPADAHWHQRKSGGTLAVEVDARPSRFEGGLYRFDLPHDGARDLVLRIPDSERLTLRLLDPDGTPLPPPDDSQHAFDVQFFPRRADGAPIIPSDLEVGEPRNPVHNTWAKAGPDGTVVCTMEVPVPGTYELRVDGVTYETKTLAVGAGAAPIPWRRGPPEGTTL